MKPSAPSTSKPKFLRDLETRLASLRLEHLQEVLDAIDQIVGKADSKKTVDTFAKRVVALDLDGSKLREVECAIIAHALAVSYGNVSAAARLLGVERKSLERRVQREKKLGRL